MTQDLFAKFDKQFDLDGLRADIKSASENKTEYAEVPDGDYEVAITKMELKASSKGSPMLSVWFKIVDGSHKNQLIFMNQVLTSGFGIHKANTFLRSLGANFAVEFETFPQYGALITELFDYAQGYEFALEYTHNAKGFADYKITDIFALN